jgi:effector-binding domain-containing protein
MTRSSGEVVAFVPVAEAFPVGGGVEPFELPAQRSAVLVHRGPFATLDLAYGTLGAYVTVRGIGGPGPIRESYVVDDADEPADLVTEVCWPLRR